MKTIYYAFVQKIEVPADTPEEKIDDFVFGKNIIHRQRKKVKFVFGPRKIVLHIESALKV